MDKDYNYLEKYRKNGGTYVIPTEILNDLLGDIEASKQALNEIREYIDNHTILIYTKNVPRELVGTKELNQIIDKVLGDDEKMKTWDEFENQDVASLLSSISYTINRLRKALTEKDYEALAGDFILLKNKLITNNRHSRYEDISNLCPIIENKVLGDDTNG